MRGVTDSSLTPYVAGGAWSLQIGDCTRLCRLHGARRGPTPTADTRRNPWAWQEAGPILRSTRLPYAYPFPPGMIWIDLDRGIRSTVRIATHTVTRIACLKYDNIMR